MLISGGQWPHDCEARPRAGEGDVGVSDHRSAKLETMCRQELKANIYRGFNLYWEQSVSGVGQRVCGRAEEHGGPWGGN